MYLERVEEKEERTGQQEIKLSLPMKVLQAAEISSEMLPLLVLPPST